MCKEISEFHNYFRPYVERIYRGALIVTGNPRKAERLQAQIYLKAFFDYLEECDIANFPEWLVAIVRECFLNYRGRTPDQETGQRETFERAIQIIAGDC